MIGLEEFLQAAWAIKYAGQLLKHIGLPRQSQISGAFTGRVHDGACGAIGGGEAPQGGAKKQTNQGTICNPAAGQGQKAVGQTDYHFQGDQGEQAEAGLQEPPDAGGEHIIRQCRAK